MPAKAGIQYPQVLQFKLDPPWLLDHPPARMMTSTVNSKKCLDPRLRAAEYQRVDVVRPFVSVDGFQIAQHAHDMEFFADAVAAVDIAGEPRDVERFAAIVSLQ